MVVVVVCATPSTEGLDMVQDGRGSVGTYTTQQNMGFKRNGYYGILWVEVRVRKRGWFSAKAERENQTWGINESKLSCPQFISDDALRRLKFINGDDDDDDDDADDDVHIADINKTSWYDRKHGNGDDEKTTTISNSITLGSFPSVFQVFKTTKKGSSRTSLRRGVSRQVDGEQMQIQRELPYRNDSIETHTLPTYSNSDSTIWLSPVIIFPNAERWLNSRMTSSGDACMAVNYVQVAVAVVELHIIRDSWAFGSIGLGLANGGEPLRGTKKPLDVDGDIDFTLNFSPSDYGGGAGVLNLLHFIDRFCIKGSPTLVLAAPR
ncbi:hypothetical protein CIB48_g81 [Xylaria polymorpha]|nr:hypothetical protein CIB48_g81 [Xylaria polymorpha]